jgi:hypothetical protein
MNQVTVVTALAKKQAQMRDSAFLRRERPGKFIQTGNSENRPDMPACVSDSHICNEKELEHSSLETCICEYYLQEHEPWDHEKHSGTKSSANENWCRETLLTMLR